MNITYELLQQLDRAHGSSFYLLKSTEFQTNILEFQNAFRAHYQNSNLGYSYKTNYIPEVCKIAHKLGTYSEIVSEMELRIAQRLNVPGCKIIYNGPAKSFESLEYCLCNKAKVNIDNLAELEQVRAIAEKYPQQKFKLGLRINIEMDDFFSRFGFDPRTDAFEYAIHAIRSVHNLKLVGLHTHSSRKDKSPDSYQSKLRYLAQLANRLFEKGELEYLNIGGGFWSKLDDNMRKQLQVKHLPTFDEYGHAVASLMKREFPDEKVELILEPGLSVTANILDYVVKVIDIRVISGRNIATTTGSHQCVKPTGHNKSLSVDIHREKSTEMIDVVYDVVGYTCLEFDVLYHALKAPLQVGDYIQFRNVGGYTLVFKPPFIKLSPAIFNVEGDQVVAVKTEERFEDTFKSYKF